MSSQPIQLSNELDDFVQAGLYPGGTGIVKRFLYTLWDYDGKVQPDSVCAVCCEIQPTDGSNEGKPVIVYWSQGPAKEYQPDHSGGFVLGVGNSKSQHLSSNWAFVLTKLRDNCGLEKGKLSEQGKGIRAMEGSEITLARVDQPKRDFNEEAPAQEPGQGGQGRGARKPTILVPTRCKFAWEKAGAKGKTTAKPTAAATATAATSAPAPASSNGSGSGSLSTVLAELLTENSGTLDVSTLPKLINEKMGANGATVKDRMDAMKTVKNEEALGAIALENSWTLDSGILSV